MKRFIVLLSVLILAFVVAACGNNAQAGRLQGTDMAMKAIQSL